MNILLISAEVTPFAKAGGLADVTAALPAEWIRNGHNPIVVMPKYGFIDEKIWNIKPTFLTLNVPMGYETEFAHLWHGTLPGTEVPIFFIEFNEYFARDGIYGDPNEYFDNDRRFIFLSRAAFETAKALDFTPDIIHAHDFHTAMAMAFLKTHYRNDKRFARTAGVYTIHNLAYQGKFNPFRAMEFTGIGHDNFYKGSWFEHNGTVNAMKIGIMFADKITTVSPNYSREIRTPYYGEGLCDELNFRGPDLVGILNGVQYDKWNPAIDDAIAAKYTPKSIKDKMINKKDFLKQFGHDDDDGNDIALIGIVARLTEQKGIDLIESVLERHIAEGDFRFALLGTGERRYIDYFNYLKDKYRTAVLINIGYDEEMAHRLIAGCDYLLVPSRFEPCGLTQMYALKYGTIPIVRQTGGLADTVTEYSKESGTGTGFVFLHYDPDDFAFALRRALAIYKAEPHWNTIRNNAMAMDYSSARSANQYINVFKWALEKVR